MQGTYKKLQRECTVRTAWPGTVGNLMLSKVVYYPMIVSHISCSTALAVRLIVCGPKQSLIVLVSRLFVPHLRSVNSPGLLSEHLV